jgi:hypothetical protein
MENRSQTVKRQLKGKQINQELLGSNLKLGTRRLTEQNTTNCMPILLCNMSKKYVKFLSLWFMACAPYYIAGFP